MAAASAAKAAPISRLERVVAGEDRGRLRPGGRRCRGSPRGRAPAPRRRSGRRSRARAAALPCAARSRLRAPSCARRGSGGGSLPPPRRPPPRPRARPLRGPGCGRSSGARVAGAAQPCSASLYSGKSCRAIATCSSRYGPRSTRWTSRARATSSPRTSGRCSSTSASATSGARGTSPAPCTCRAGTSSRASRPAAPDRAQPIVLYCAAGNRSAFAAKTLEELGYENVVVARRRLHRLEAQRLPDRAAPHARRGEALALQPAHPHSRGRRGGAAEAARVARSS